MVEIGDLEIGAARVPPEAGLRLVRSTRRTSEEGVGPWALQSEPRQTERDVTGSLPGSTGADRLGDAEDSSLRSGWGHRRSWPLPTVFWSRTRGQRNGPMPFRLAAVSLGLLLPPKPDLPAMRNTEQAGPDTPDTREAARFALANAQAVNLSRLSASG